MKQESTQSEKYLFTLTAFGEDADRVSAPLVLANSAPFPGIDAVL